MATLADVVRIGFAAALAGAVWRRIVLQLQQKSLPQPPPPSPPSNGAAKPPLNGNSSLAPTSGGPHKLSDCGVMRDLAPTLTCKTYFQGKWHDGNIAIMGAADHATWLGSSCFDGARYYDRCCPDLDEHMKRIVRSATNLGMDSPLTAVEIMRIAMDGIRLYPPEAELYIRPFMWSTGFGPGFVMPKADSCQFSMCIEEMPLGGGSEQSMTVTPLLRKCNLTTAPTDAKAVCLYPHYGRMSREALSRGFNVALALDANGNVAETHSANVFMAKDGIVFTPIPNGSFLSGITRKRVIGLLRDLGVSVVEKSLVPADFAAADEIFCTGNAFKVQPMSRFEERKLPAPGPMAVKAKEAYAKWAKTQTMAAVSKAQGL